MIYAKFTGEIDCDCGSIFVLTGRLTEDHFLDLMDALDDNEGITIKQYKKNARKKRKKSPPEEFGYSGA